MNKEEMTSKVEEYKNGFHIPMVIGAYLALDIIILFALCLGEIYFNLSHQIVLMLSMIIEFLIMLFVAIKGNLKSAIILFILLLVSPAFLGLIAMGMHAILGNNAIPFTPTILYAFRTGYTLNGEKLNNIMRFVITFRLPSVGALIVGILAYFLKSKKEVQE